MPKRRADDILEGAPEPKLPRDQTAGRVNQAEYIISNSFVTAVPCDHCFSAGEDCVMDRSRRYSKCASCTRAGRTCKRDFHTNKEWDLLRAAESKISVDLEKNEDELDLLEPELNDLQTRLADMHQQLLLKQKQYQEAMSRQRRLRKQQKFLKERGFRMSEHDAELLEILDEKRPSPGQPVPSAAIQQLAATADDPSFSQMVAEIDQMSPSFWANLDLPPGGIAEQVVGNPSGSQ